VTSGEIEFVTCNVIFPDSKTVGVLFSVTNVTVFELGDDGLIMFPKRIDICVPAIKVRKNSSFKSGGCYTRKMSVVSQMTNYQYWKDSVSYGKRWIVESVFSALKRIFGEHVMAHKRQNMVKELQLKAALYNRFMSM
jgi:hypothetical protein